VSSRNKPRIGEFQPTSKKVPRTSENPDAYHDKCPVWRVAGLDVGCPLYGWNHVEGATAHIIRERLGHYEKMTFREILRADCHEIETWKLCKDARDRMASIPLHAETLMSLRVNSRGRVWGIRTRNIIDLLWWDPEHAVYPVPKKGT
jgi:hypothetical protein